MHAGRILQQRKKRRDSKRYAKMLRAHQQHFGNSSAATTNNLQSPTLSQSASNDHLFEKLEDRRKSVAVEREKRHINLLHVGIILLIIGVVMVAIGFFMESYPTTELGLVALLFGLYLTIGCGCRWRKRPSTSESYAKPLEEENVDAESSSPEVIENPAKNGLVEVEPHRSFTPNISLENEKYKPKGDKIICSKPAFDIIPEDEEEEEELERRRSSLLQSTNGTRPPTPTPSVTIKIEDFSDPVQQEEEVETNVPT